MKVFISYCQGKEISEKSLKLADNLITYGIDCVIDQYVVSPSEGWPKWMEKQIREADYVLVVCTSKYLNRTLGHDDSGKGVQFETNLSYNHIYQNYSRNDKYIPIVFKYSDLEYIPEPLKSYNHYCLCQSDGFESLYRRLTNQPKIVKPNLGKLRRLSSEEDEFEPIQFETLTNNLYSSNYINTSIDVDNYEIEISINKDFDNYSEKEQQRLLFTIKNLLELKTDLKIKQKRKGSVILRFELSLTQCEKLQWAIQSGKLSDFKVVGSKILNSKLEDINRNQKKIYSIKEAFYSTLNYFKGDDLAARVWLNKYALKDLSGNLYELTPDDMHRRLASEIARIENHYENPMTENEIFELFKDFKYIVPQGGPMAGIGNDFKIFSLSNCFVIGNGTDSYGGITLVDLEQVQLMKRRGGVGHDLSHIRPKGSPIKNSDLMSTGIVPLMERYSNSTREAAQDGRRGALMLSLSIKHPDFEELIDNYTDKGRNIGTNVSIKIDDEFMQSVPLKNKYIQKFPIDSTSPFFSKKIDAAKLWKKIIFNIWKSAEPVILFWDTIIKESIPDCYADLGYKTVSTNPCGEIPLCPYDSCRLAVVNLYSYVDNPFTKNAKFNFDLFKKHVGIAQRIMDDIIDLELEKINVIIEKIDSDPESADVKNIERSMWVKIRTKAMEGRRTGLGITAEGDMFAALGLVYGSDIATDFAEEIHKNLALEAYRSSVVLAKERGAFTIYSTKREKNNPMINRLRAEDEELYRDMVKYGRRNIALLTIAPTGTTSIMTQTTSGIEPVFMPVYKRRRKVKPIDKDANIDFVDEMGDGWEVYDVFHHKFKIWMEVNGYMLKKNYSNEELEALLAKSPYFKATSDDINWMNKVRMQGTIQKWIDHAISVTINVPTDCTEKQIGDLIFEAWRYGCKGVTVYRAESYSEMLSNMKEQEELEIKRNILFPKARPTTIEADVLRFINSKDKCVAFIGKIDNKPYEIFVGLANEKDGILLPHSVTQGWIIKSQDESSTFHYQFQYRNTRGYRTTIKDFSSKFNPTFNILNHLLSSILSSGTPIAKVIETVTSIQSSNDKIDSWKFGVSHSLRKYVPNGTVAEGAVCIGCGSHNVIYQEGLLICNACFCIQSG